MQDRFEAKFQVTPGCWIWLASCMSNGYGAFAVEGKMTGAHRVSYALHVAEIPSGMHVLHRCDNKRCVNPDHLFVGTPKINMLDKEKKKRGNHPRGETHVRAKLTAEQVCAIRSDKRVPRVIAEEYGVSMRSIRAIRAGLYWKNT